MSRYLLGLDAGTTSFKGAIFSEDHRLAAASQRDYTLLTPGRDQVEFPAEEYWRAMCALIGDLLAKSGIPAREIAAMAISSQGETLITLDAAGTPIGNAIVWLDNRAVKESDALRDAFGRRAVYEKTGQADMTATWPAAKILWLKRNQPQRFQGTAKFLLLEDYLIYRLTGRFAGEPNLWASSAMLDIHTAAWWGEMLEKLGVTEDRLPEIVPCGCALGGVTEAAAAETGLNPGMTVAAGALDQTCNAIGCGMTLPGTICETTGSCLAVSAVLDKFVPYREDMMITCQNHAVPGRYTVLLWSQSAGMVLKWFAKKFYPEYEDLDQAFERMNRDAAGIAPGSDGLTMLPHLSGASNPEYDPFARGVFCGATLEHGRAHFTRAIMEAVACMLRRNLEQLTALGAEFDGVYCMGGGAKSPLWLSVKADVTGKAMRPLMAAESGCLGAAILAAVAAGIDPDADALSQSVAAAREIAPKGENGPACEALYRRYTALYEALKPYFAMCAQE